VRPKVQTPVPPSPKVKHRVNLWRQVFGYRISIVFPPDKGKNKRESGFYDGKNMFFLNDW
jgi:hypothetical protein